MKCIQRQMKKMASPLMSEPPRTTAPPPPPPLPPATDSFRQKNKTNKKTNPVNVRLPSALVSVASRCDSTRCTSWTHFTTCHRGQAVREWSLRLTWKIREQRARKHNPPLLILLPGSLRARNLTYMLLLEIFSAASIFTDSNKIQFLLLINAELHNWYFLLRFFPMRALFLCLVFSPRRFLGSNAESYSNVHSDWERAVDQQTDIKIHGVQSCGNKGQKIMTKNE